MPVRRRIDLAAAGERPCRHLGLGECLWAEICLFIGMTPLGRAKGQKRGSGYEQVPSLRRHDPDQVRRVSARASTRQRTLSPSLGLPSEQSQSRPRAAHVKPRAGRRTPSCAAAGGAALGGGGGGRSGRCVAWRGVPQMLIAHDREDGAERDGGRGAGEDAAVASDHAVAERLHRAGKYQVGGRREG